MTDQAPRREDVLAALEAKSDQLNALDLSAPRRLKVTRVQIKPKGSEQPYILHYDGDHGRPWKPSLGMRRAIVQLWGDDPRAWVGREVEVFLEPSVTYGGKAVGGIWISAMSHIPRAVEIVIRRSQHVTETITIRPLEIAPDVDAEASREECDKWIIAFEAATPESRDALKGGLKEKAKNWLRADKLRAVEEVKRIEGES